ncbi:MAG: glycosyltransferase family 4 protein [Gammaproteobacteria bacterium]
MKKIFLFVNVDWFFYSHRLPIAKAALNHDIDMTVYTDITDKRRNANLNEIKVTQSPLSRSSKSSWSILIEFFKLYRLVSTARPDLLHAVTIKPIIFVGLISRFTKIPFVAAISGFGPVINQSNMLSRIRYKFVSVIYKFVLDPKSASVICQSENDKSILISSNICNESKINMMPGSGVDLQKFTPSIDSNHDRIVLMASRILRDKGINEFCYAAKKLSTHDRNIKFLLAGPIDELSPSAISAGDLKKICIDCNVEYLGDRADMSDLLASSSIFVMPSYYPEGIPKVLLEASACGIPVITTDHPGCRDAVIEGKTGLLVKTRNYGEIVKAVSYLFDNPDIMKKMGKAGRRHAEVSFNEKQIVESHYELYRTLFNHTNI